MLHSLLAVVAGYVVMALVVMLATILALRFVLKVTLATMRSGARPPLSPAYLRANLAASGLAAVVGGYITAFIAGHDGVFHGLALAGLMVVMSLVSMRQAGGAQPRWYQLVLLTVMPALAVAGAGLCGAIALP